MRSWRSGCPPTRRMRWSSSRGRRRRAYRFVNDRVSWAYGSSSGVQEALSDYLRKAMIKDTALGSKANLDKFQVATNRAELRRRLRGALPGISAGQIGNVIVMLGIDYHMAGNMPRIHKKGLQKVLNRLKVVAKLESESLKGDHGPSVGDTSGELGHVRPWPHDARNLDDGKSLHEGHCRRRQQRSPLPIAGLDDLPHEELGEELAQAGHGKRQLEGHAEPDADDRPIVCARMGTDRGRRASLACRRNTSISVYYEDEKEWKRKLQRVRMWVRLEKADRFQEHKRTREEDTVKEAVIELARGRDEKGWPNKKVDLTLKAHAGLKGSMDPLVRRCAVGESIGCWRFKGLPKISREDMTFTIPAPWRCKCGRWVPSAPRLIWNCCETDRASQLEGLNVRPPRDRLEERALLFSHQRRPSDFKCPPGLLPWGHSERRRVAASLTTMDFGQVVVCDASARDGITTACILIGKRCRPRRRWRSTSPSARWTGRRSGCSAPTPPRPSTGWRSVETRWLGLYGSWLTTVHAKWRGSHARARASGGGRQHGISRATRSRSSGTCRSWRMKRLRRIGCRRPRRKNWKRKRFSGRLRLPGRSRRGPRPT